MATGQAVNIDCEQHKRQVFLPPGKMQLSLLYSILDKLPTGAATQHSIESDAC